ncbi:MAG: hypothetical protein D6728_21270 [Cyanobacteria bacterium J055]|nr:MAG: hypothetical protein D6728_21270 [Cyanobacteria bacterium J055]
MPIQFWRGLLAILAIPRFILMGYPGKSQPHLNRTQPPKLRLYLTIFTFFCINFFFRFITKLYELGDRLAL